MKFRFTATFSIDARIKLVTQAWTNTYVMNVYPLTDFIQSLLCMSLASLVGVFNRKYTITEYLQWGLDEGS